MWTLKHRCDEGREGGTENRERKRDGGEVDRSVTNRMYTTTYIGQVI